MVFASDNGAAVQAPLKLLKCNGVFRGRKGLLYEGGIRVPLIVNQPGKIPVRTLENIIYFPDMMPTFAALTGSNKHLPQHLNGINILPLFMASNWIPITGCSIGSFPGYRGRPVKVTGNVSQPREVLL